MSDTGLVVRFVAEPTAAALAFARWSLKRPESDFIELLRRRGAPDRIDPEVETVIRSLLRSPSPGIMVASGPSGKTREDNHDPQEMERRRGGAIYRNRGMNLGRRSRPVKRWS